MQLTSIDWLIMTTYFVFVLGIGWILKRYTKTSTDFFLAGRAIPAWVCGLAFLSANLGAQEVIGSPTPTTHRHGRADRAGRSTPGLGPAGGCGVFR